MTIPTTLKVYDKEHEWKYCVTMYRIGFDKEWEPEVYGMLQEAGIEPKDFLTYPYRVRMTDELWQMDIWFNDKTTAAKFHILYS